MHISPKIITILFSITLFAVFLLFTHAFVHHEVLSSETVTLAGVVTIPPLPSPTVPVSALIDTPSIQNEKPEPVVTQSLIGEKREYTIVMVGDSMTHALGPHGGTFNGFINDLYRLSGHGILIDNYGVGSTNVLTLEDAMQKKVTYWDATFAPLLSRDFDIILIESFGYNPLSQFPISVGLQKQNEALDLAVTTLHRTHPKSLIIFVATISPNKENYARNELLNVPVSDRIAEANERIAYIKNHMLYAKTHSIPLIDIFDKSLDANGDGQLKYINPTDYIHPSFAGIDFIGHELANYIYDNDLLPK